MTLQNFLDTLAHSPETIDFNDTMAVIDCHYTFSPCAFRNGQERNEAGQNSGSCKLFAFAKLNKLKQQHTLDCFGQYYRNDVLTKPEGTDHQNIRNFIATGWDGIHFEDSPLKPI
ncbi:MAG: hypothetical protein ACI9T9_001383 [Oleiphilaceae bacterium]|jgi:hypothetical protein